MEIEVTYWGGDTGRRFDILVNGQKVASESLYRPKPGEFMTKRYQVPERILQSAQDNKLTIRFQATEFLAGGIYDLRLMKPDSSNQ